jgi:hypothetical protein
LAIFIIENWLANCLNVSIFLAYFLNFLVVKYTIAYILGGRPGKSGFFGWGVYLKNRKIIVKNCKITPSRQIAPLAMLILSRLFHDRIALFQVFFFGGGGALM